MIKWLFFDLGSTLIDEGACDMFRFRHMLTQPGAPEKDVLIEKMHEYSRKGLHPYKTALKEYGLESCFWPIPLERVDPFAETVLYQLQKKYKLGIIANQLPGVEKRLEPYGIGMYFDVIVSSAEVGCAKPDPEIFRIALEQAGCAPEEAIMIGDRPDNDILPAKALGMHTVWVRQGMFRFCENMENVADYTIEKIRDLTEILL